jgi:uncharacterized protein (TIRG00374 family)
MSPSRNTLKLALGLAVGASFLWLAVRNVDFGRFLGAMRQADYGYVLLSVAVLMLAHVMRALRQRYFLAPVKLVDARSLFSALMVGYAANSFVPAHLGEFLRAFVLGKRQSISASAAFASIVVERLLDMLSLIAAMALVLIVHPFPEWVEQSAYLLLAGSLLTVALLLAAKRFEPQTAALLRTLARPLPESVGRRLESVAANFLAGFTPLQSAGHYVLVAALSAGIWLCYVGVYYICLEAFNFIADYRLPWYVGMVVLVLTTISVVVPSTPGYVGTYHYLCQVALVMFAVPASEALSFAVVAHAVNLLPVTVAGLIAANFEGVAIFRTTAESRKL